MANEYSNQLLKMLDEKEAKRVSYVENKFLGDKVLVRRFPAPSDKDEALGITFMGLYTSAKNYDVTQANHAEVATVLDPEADGVVYPGTWKQLSLEKPKVKAGAEQQGIYQTLRIWPIIVGQGVTDWSCRFKTIGARYWGLTSAEAFAMMTAITAPSQGTTIRVQGPNPDGDGGYSVWVFTTVRTAQTIPEFISGRDMVSFQKTQELIGSTNGTTLTVPDSAPQGLVYTKTVDKNEDCTYNEKRGVDTSVSMAIGPVITGESAVEEEKTSDYFNSRNPVAAPLNSQGNLYRASLKMGRDGTYSGPLVHTASKSVLVGPVTAADSAVEKQTVYDYLNSRTLYGAPGAVQGTLYHGGLRMNPDGTYSGPIQHDTSKELLIGPVVTADSMVEQESVYDYLNSRTLYGMPAAVQGTLYRGGLRMNPDGTYTGPIQAIYSKELVIGPVATGQDSLGTTYDTAYHAYRSPVTAPDAVQGSVYDGSNRLNPDGTYEGDVRDRTSKPLLIGPVTSGDSLLERETMYDYFNSRTLYGAPDGVQGYLYRSGLRMERDGTYSGPFSQVYSKELAVGPVMTHQDAHGYQRETMYHAYRTTIEADANVQGSMYDASSRLNPDGTYEGTKNERTSKEVLVGPVSVEDTALSTTQESLYINSRTRPQVGTYTQGAVYTARSSMNPDGTYGGVYTGEISKAVVIGPVVTGARLSGTTNEKQNLNARTASALNHVPGFIYSRSLELQRDGTYGEKIQEQKGERVQFGPVCVVSSMDEQVLIYGDENAPSQPTDLSQAGVYVDDRYESIDLNDFGLYSTKRVIRTKKAPKTGERTWREQGENTIWVNEISGAIVIVNHFYCHHEGWVPEGQLPSACTSTSGTARGVQTHYTGHGLWYYHYWIHTTGSTFL